MPVNRGCRDEMAWRWLPDASGCPAGAGLANQVALPNPEISFRGALAAPKQKGRSDGRCGLKRGPAESGTRPASCRRLRWKTTGSTNCPNVPMTASSLPLQDLALQDLASQDLVPQDLASPSSAAMGRPQGPAWAREPVLTPLVWQRPAWAQRQAWAQRRQRPSFLQDSSWRWPSWPIFSAPPPWTFWRISSQPCWLFSPISLPTSWKISLRFSSSPSEAFSCSFYSSCLFCSFFP
jgi:hypothetical protein